MITYTKKRGKRRGGGEQLFQMEGRTVDTWKAEGELYDETTGSLALSAFGESRLVYVYSNIECL